MATAGARYEERTGNIWSYAHRGDLTGLKAALARGVDVNMSNTVGWTPAHAAAAGGQTKALRFLAKAGADFDISDRGGDLPAHQAAKNGHVHALRALQELGADVAKVRLSQAKGKAARDELIKAYKRAGRQASRVDEDGGDDADSEEEIAPVGYARKQAKSTAFWGPRRQPISTKIKKKIIKEKRLKKKEKMTIKWGPADGDGTSSSNESQEEEEEEEGLSRSGEEISQAQDQHEASYIETVRNIKRNKKHRRRQQQMRRQQNDQPSSDTEAIENDNLISESDSSKGSSEDEEDTNDESRSATNGFAALLLTDSSDSEEES
ncbi:hypothetical protein ACHAWF_003238 [Thalassiosira exigua]